MLRYAARAKPHGQRLTDFVKALGGLNEAARLFAQAARSVSEYMGNVAEIRWFWSGRPAARARLVLQDWAIARRRAFAGQLIVSRASVHGFWCLTGGTDETRRSDALPNSNVQEKFVLEKMCLRGSNGCRMLAAKLLSGDEARRIAYEIGGSFD